MSRYFKCRLPEALLQDAGEGTNNKHRSWIATSLALLAMTVVVSGCGIKGELKRPVSEKAEQEKR